MVHDQVLRLSFYLSSPYFGIIEVSVGVAIHNGISTSVKPLLVPLSAVASLPSIATYVAELRSAAAG